jgi:hypothetical protein
MIQNLNNFSNKKCQKQNIFLQCFSQKSMR